MGQGPQPKWLHVAYHKGKDGDRREGNQGQADPFDGRTSPEHPHHHGQHGQGADGGKYIGANRDERAG